MSDDSGEVVPYHNPDIVAELTELLDQAKAGKILAFAYTAKRKHRDKWFRNWFGDDEEGMGGSLLCLMFEMLGPEPPDEVA